MCDDRFPYQVGMDGTSRQAVQVVREAIKSTGREVVIEVTDPMHIVVKCETEDDLFQVTLTAL